MKLPISLKVSLGFSIFFVSIFFILIGYFYLESQSEILLRPFLIISAILYLYISMVAPIIAMEKDHSIGGFMLMSIFITPIIAIIIALIINPNKSNI